MARILVIDDDPDIRETVRRVLASRGHVVETVHDGAAGIATIAERAPDLVFTDIFMPGPRRDSDPRRAAQGLPTLKVIAMSGGSGGGLISLFHDAELLGADRTIPKPFVPRELIAAVTEVLGRAKPSR